VETKLKETFDLKIDFFEHEHQELSRFLSFLLVNNKKSNIPDHLKSLYDDSISRADNIDIVSERLYDIRKRLESLKNVAHQ
jgi:hypothetical protein